MANTNEFVPPVENLWKLVEWLRDKRTTIAPSAVQHALADNISQFLYADDARQRARMEEWDAKAEAKEGGAE